MDEKIASFGAHNRSESKQKSVMCANVLMLNCCVKQIMNMDEIINILKRT